MEERMITHHRGWRGGCSTLWIEERTKKRMSPKRKEENLVTTKDGGEVGSKRRTQRTEKRIVKKIQFVT